MKRNIVKILLTMVLTVWLFLEIIDYNMKIEYVVAIPIAFILEFGFMHRYLICSKKSKKTCTNKLCYYYGNGMCERSAEQLQGDE